MPPLDMNAYSKRCSSALWRGYIGHWRIENARLWLDTLTWDFEPSDADEAEIRPEVMIDLRAIFDGMPGPIDCSWFTGKLRLQLDPMLVYVHMGWNSSFRFERIIYIQKGQVVRTRHVDHTARFLAKYAELHEMLRKKGHDDAQIGWGGLTRISEEGHALAKEKLDLSRYEDFDRLADWD